jgi:hypothetical protein
MGAGSAGAIGCAGAALAAGDVVFAACAGAVAG